MMKRNGPLTLADNPIFRVVVTWVWWFVGAALTVLVILSSYHATFSSARETLGGNRHLAVYIEIVSVGLLPIMFTLISRDGLAQYGISRKGFVKSFLYSSLFVATIFSLNYLSKGQLMNDDRPDIFLDFPWNLWYAGLGIFAWGPLEVFFVTWLITNTDKIFKNRDRTISWGLIITVVIFGLLHILTTRSVFNALYTGTIFLILGLIYKVSGNAIGPMIAWTLINGQVWYIARVL